MALIPQTQKTKDPFSKLYEDIMAREIVDFDMCFTHHAMPSRPPNQPALDQCIQRVFRETDRYLLTNGKGLVRPSKLQIDLALDSLKKRFGKSNS